MHNASAPCVYRFMTQSHSLVNAPGEVQRVSRLATVPLCELARQDLEASLAKPGAMELTTGAASNIRTFVALGNQR